MRKYSYLLSLSAVEQFCHSVKIHSLYTLFCQEERTLVTKRTYTSQSLCIYCFTYTKYQDILKRKMRFGNWVEAGAVLAMCLAGLANAQQAGPLAGLDELLGKQKNLTIFRSYLQVCYSLVVLVHEKILISNRDTHRFWLV